MTTGNKVGDVCGQGGCGGIIKEDPDGYCYCPFCRWLERDDYYDD